MSLPKAAWHGTYFVSQDFNIACLGELHPLLAPAVAGPHSHLQTSTELEVWLCNSLTLKLMLRQCLSTG